MKKLERGDTLIVWKLDRLGRSLADLIRMLDDFKKRGVKFRIDSIAAFIQPSRIEAQFPREALVFTNSRFAYENCPSTPMRGF